MSNSPIIICRSSQEIYDDELCELHSALTNLRNRLCDGRLLFQGESQRRLSYWLARVNRAILGEVEINPYEVWFAISRI